MANGIDFVIGGKDQAKPAMASVEKSLERLEKKTDSLGSATSRLAKVTGALVGAYAAFKGVVAMIGGVGRLNAAYDQQTEAVKGLEVALGLQGASVSVESARLQKFAGDMQKLTGVGDELTLAMMKQASMMGVATEDLDDMAKAAIGLGEVMGTSAESGMEMMRRAQEGNFMQFQRTFPEIAKMATEEEKLAFVTALAAKGLEAKVEASNRVAGMSERASGAVGDLMESVGALLAPVRILISAGIKTLAESLSTLLVPAVAYAEEVLANIGPMMDWVREKVIAGINGVIGAFTFLEVTLKNLDQLWIYVESYVELTMRQIGETIMHTLVEVIPAYVMWFGENIINLFRDAWNGVLQVFYNATRMIAEILIELWEFVVNDMGSGSAALGERIGAILASGLTTGFESALTELPNIAARQISEREQQLTDTMAKIGDNLGGEFAEKMKARMVGAAAGIGDGINKEIDLSLNAAGESASDNKAKRKDGTLGASINAMESRLLTRGPGSTYEQQMLGETKLQGQILLRTGEWVKATLEEMKIMAAQNRNAVRVVPVP